jgi:hypothetical protein
MRHTERITNSEDIIDSRSVINRIRELERQLDSWECETCHQTITWNAAKDSEEGHTDDCDSTEETSDDCGLDIDDREELTQLLGLQKDAEGYSDWQDGATLIRDSYFTEYAEEFAEDIGAIDSNLRDNWPYTCIDWKQAAIELQMDYTSVEFSGVTYWIR